MKNSILRLLAISLITNYFALTTCFAQAPQRLSYQAEIRNASNALIVNSTVGMRFSILQGSATGTVVYSERHTPTTNANGLVSLQIGGGTVISGVFASIAWGSGSYFLKTETDPAGGTNYTISGTQQMLSVPYALFSGNGIPAGGGNGQVLTNCNGVALWTTGGFCPGTITALNCTSATNTGTLASGTAASGVSSAVPYTGGNGGPHSGQTVTSTGVTGLTATLAAGSFASGAGSLTYTITGTAVAGGTASFALSIGGQTCILTRTILGSITALTCASATNTGTLTRGVAASGVNAAVPYTGGNGGAHNGQTVASTGVTGLTATLAAGTFASGAGSLTYTITGTAASAGTASFALNIGGRTCTLARTVAQPAGTVTALSCAGATASGTLTSGTAASGVSSSVPYTGGNGGTYTAQSVTSTGVTGLTASLAAGTFASGAGNLSFTITGTPASSGIASFAISVGGQSCTFTRTVLPVGTVTALNCVGATASGTLTSGTAASGVSSSVPYTGGNGGTYTARSVTSTGVTGLTASLAAGTLASGAGNLTYTITGTPASSGTASFALSLGGQSCTLTRTVLPVATLTALNCATATNSGTLTSGTAASGVSSSVPYTGGNGGTYTARSITSTGVTGLTASLAAGTLASGAGNLTYTINGTPASSGTASFALSLGGLTCTLTRTVIGLASLSTTAASGITSTAATSGGNITADGGAAITARGVCWSTSANPTIALTTKTSNGTGTGSFTSSVSGLSPNTKYYVRSYAINAAGTAYGNQVSFSTNPMDADGNAYTTVTIGTQVWMKENLKTSKYRNGDVIPTGQNNTQWLASTSGAYAIYNNDVVNNSTYGKLYNWYAMSDPRGLCPSGWHVPTNHDWNLLVNSLDPQADTNCVSFYLNGCIDQVIAKMKSTGSIQGGNGLWSIPNADATNSSGFTGLPSGSRDYDGNYLGRGEYAIWWVTGNYADNPNRWGFSLPADKCRNSQRLDFIGPTANNAYGFSVRCLKD